MSEEINLKDEIVRLLDREPFVPFVVVLTSGDCYEVTDPHSLALGQNVLIIVPPRSAHVFMRWNQVSSVEVKEPVS
jgi:hypothetical protein